MKKIEQAYAEIKRLYMSYGSEVLSDWNKHKLAEEDRQYRSGYANGLRDALFVVESILSKEISGKGESQ